jgi:sugar phosphate isomerase/epimerase
VKLACQEQMIPAGTLEQKFEWALAAGWDAIELRGKGDLAFADRLPELRRARRAGVVMPTVCVDMTHFIGAFDADLRADAIRNIASQLTVIAQVGGQGVATPASWGMFSYRLPPFVPPRSSEADRQVLLDALHVLGEHAEREGVHLYLEPLNRYEDHMVNRLDDAVSLIDEIGSPAIRVVADFFHMNIEEADISRSLRRAAPYLGHIQVSDSNRLEPGAGHLDWSSALATLDDIGYTGYFALESRLSGPAEQAVPAAAAFLRGFDPL